MKTSKFNINDSTGKYTVSDEITEAEIIQMALELSKNKLKKGVELTSPLQVKAHLQTIMHDYEHEVFGVLFMDNQHRVIRFEEMFRGTIDAASVYPREVVKRGLELNCAAAIFAHNHPSGTPEPSQADRRITRRLKDALELVDIRTLDHFVIGSEGCVSFAERGWM
jgi:DNA repair protein RadC